MVPMGALGWRCRKASTTGAISSEGIGAWRRHGRTRSTVAIPASAYPYMMRLSTS